MKATFIVLFKFQHHKLNIESMKNVSELTLQESVALNGGVWIGLHGHGCVPIPKVPKIPVILQVQELGVR